MKTIVVSHYSDILCVWAYVAQARIDELEKGFGEQVRLEYYFCSVFGSIRKKIENNWAHRGGAEAYGQHVLGVGKSFGLHDFHPEVWTKNVPESSMPCHAFLAAAFLSEDNPANANRCVARVSRRMRLAFFAECRNISLRAVQLEIAEELKLSTKSVEASLDNGQAYAVLNDHFESARDQGIRVSPTLIFNEGRQRLTGNVGYRVIEANIRELLQAPDAGELASWC